MEINKKKHTEAFFFSCTQLAVSGNALHLKSVNLQYNTLVRWADGTNDSSTKHLMFQVSFLECQTIGRRVVCPIVPENQHIILQIVGFQIFYCYQFNSGLALVFSISNIFYLIWTILKNFFPSHLLMKNGAKRGQYIHIGEKKKRKAFSISH